MQRMVLEPGVHPTMVARPEEVFERLKAEVGAHGSPVPDASAAPTRTAALAMTSERFRSDLPDSTGNLPWNAAEALLQLKLALGDSPILRPVNAETVNITSSALPKTLGVSGPSSASSEGQSAGSSRALFENSFLPPVVRYNTFSPSSSDYTQRELISVHEACKRLERQLGDATQRTTTATRAADLQWAHVLYCLQEPELVSKLQRRAEAAIWEKECVFRLNDFLNAELRCRGVPVEIAQEDFKPFLDQVLRSRTLLDDYVCAQRATSTLAPMLDAAVARAACLRDVASLSSPECTDALERLGQRVTGLSAQVKEDTGLLRKNMDAMQRRLDALQKSTAALQQ
ncbi:hypothetical protein ABB37_00347 [Leptomonas pyrrhocoris]|uniref:Uncharacterized protein n=1 Tax=Leptomonas pyrrhocoris TaxID=157538 RepID=A0A0M9GA56_LEPPY|nr:hypothetical protein ABB37_00347 [Leptomonas pyrrhocoris]KPA86080.1 hypothetical protein ABB37_00347 [Leptomonas pyrrhocoris]|eukprot:XP_015664519.1 hypothetical protein ABB37_00347 [Leptomonas pyrrhocoris]